MGRINHQNTGSLNMNTAICACERGPAQGVVPQAGIYEHCTLWLQSCRCMSVYAGEIGDSDGLMVTDGFVAFQGGFHLHIKK